MTARHKVPVEVLGRRLAHARRVWWTLAPLTGLLLTGSVVYQLYFAFISYVLEHTGTTRNTGAGSGVTQVIVSVDGTYMLLLYMAELMSLLAWLRFIWLSLLLTDRIAPGLRRLSPLATIAGFFVPVASFWIQIQAMNDIARVARASEKGRRPLHPVLPAAITLSLFVALQFSRAVADMPIDVFSDPYAAQHAMQISSIADIAAFMLLILCDAFMLSVVRGQARALAKEKGRRSEPAPELREEKSKEGMSDYADRNPAGSS